MLPSPQALGSLARSPGHMCSLGVDVLESGRGSRPALVPCVNLQTVPKQTDWLLGQVEPSLLQLWELASLVAREPRAPQGSASVHSCLLKGWLWAVRARVLGPRCLEPVGVPHLPQTHGPGTCREERGAGPLTGAPAPHPRVLSFELKSLEFVPSCFSVIVFKFKIPGSRSGLLIRNVRS